MLAAAAASGPPGKCQVQTHCSVAPNNVFVAVRNFPSLHTLLAIRVVMYNVARGSLEATAAGAAEAAQRRTHVHISRHTQMLDQVPSVSTIVIYISISPC